MKQPYHKRKKQKEQKPSRNHTSYKIKMLKASYKMMSKESRITKNIITKRKQTNEMNK